MLSAGAMPVCAGRPARVPILFFAAARHRDSRAQCGAGGDVMALPIMVEPYPVTHGVSIARAQASQAIPGFPQFLRSLQADVASNLRFDYDNWQTFLVWRGRRPIRKK